MIKLAALSLASILGLGAAQPAPETHNGDTLYVLASDEHSGGILVNLSSRHATGAGQREAIVISLKPHAKDAPLTEVVAVSQWMTASCGWSSPTLTPDAVRAFQNRLGNTLHTEAAATTPEDVQEGSLDYAIWWTICYVQKDGTVVQ